MSSRLQTRYCGTLILLLLLTGAGGCASSGTSWGQRTGPVQSWQELGEAARSAAAQPSVWLPLAGAAVLGVADLDDNISDWAVRKQPLFGANAGDVSDDLLDVSTGTLVLSALLAPSNSGSDKLWGLATQAGTVALTGGVVEGMKRLTDRERPDGSDRKSLPSGHASQSAVRTHLTRTNLEYIRMPETARRVSGVALHSLTFATAWARVEANKHYASDVLAGIAVGNYIAQFLRLALFEGEPASQAALRFEWRPGGGVVRFSKPLGPGQ